MNWNKNVVPNGVALALIGLGGMMGGNEGKVVLNIGLFAFSGAITNWLAVHMLFEKVPGLYGSGVIPAHFEDFKKGIHHLVMSEFFTKENVEEFFENTQKDDSPAFDFTPIIEGINLDPAFDSLVSVINESPFAGLLAMVGGEEGLQPLKEPFIHKVKGVFTKIAQSQEFHHLVRLKFHDDSTSDDMLEKVGNIVDKRLDELTPQMVKEIIQKMIQDHLGWLVVWGGVFGGVIGLLTSWIQL